MRVFHPPQGLCSAAEQGLSSQHPLLLGMEPLVGVGWGTRTPPVSAPPFSWSSASPAPLPLSGNSGFSRSRDDMEEDCPWDTP